MFQNYLKIAVKHLLSHKLYSAINILGLAVGLACAILISLFVIDELSYDRFFADTDRIYRVSRDYYPGELGRVSGRVPASINAPFGPQLKTDFPQVEEYTRLYSFLQPLVRQGEALIQEDGLMFADASFPDIFSLRWLLGNPASALAQPFSIVLTRSLAEKYFGAAEALGQTLAMTFDEEVTLQVTGVIADLPTNTHLNRIDALASMSTLTSMFGEDFLQSWQGNTDFHTYIRQAPGASIEELERQFPAFVDRYVGEGASAVSGITAMRLTDIHLRSQRSEELTPPGNLLNVLAFVAIAAAILLIACINFMNLSTARSSQRAREVGMRKTIGAQKRQLVRQFLGESLFLALLAMAAAIVLVEMLLPGFNAFTGKALDFAYLLDWRTLGFLLLLVLAVGLVAGSYPAFFLSAFNPARVLKGDLSRGGAGILFRQGLVVLQFSISIALVIATAVIYAQTNYARSIDLGLDKEQIVVLSGSRFQGLGSQWPAMKQQLLAHPQITHVTSSHFTPFTHDDNSLPVLLQRNAAVEVQLMKYMAVDYDFFATYGIELLAGRAFAVERDDRIGEGENGEAPGGVIINAAAAAEFGWTPEEAVAQGLVIATDPTTETRYPIIGVAEDSHFESLTTPLEPLVFFIPPPGFRGTPSLPQAGIRLSGDDVPGALAHIDQVWRQFMPELPVSRHFLNEDFEALYQTEQR